MEIIERRGLENVNLNSILQVIQYLKLNKLYLYRKIYFNNTYIYIQWYGKYAAYPKRFKQIKQYRELLYIQIKYTVLRRLISGRY